MATALKNKNNGWIKTVLNDPQYFRVIGSGVDVWVGKKNFLSTKSVQGTKIASIESEVDYFNRPSRANMQPKVGRVAFAKMRDTLKVLLSDEELSKFYILSTGFALIEPQIESAYLYQVLQTQRFNLQKDRYAEGSTQQAISQSDFDKLTISFPEDRQGQRKITEILSTIDGAIEKTDALIEKYKRMKTGMMQDLFRYGIDEKGKIRSEKTHKFKNSPLGKIPAEWEVQMLEELNVQIIDGDRGENYPNQGDFLTDGYCVFLSTDNVTTNGFRFDNVQFISKEKDKKLRKGKLMLGDIVLTTRGTIGNMAYYDKNIDFQNMRINSGMILFRILDNTIDPTFFYKALSDFLLLKQYGLVKSGSAQPQLPIKDLSKFYFLKPPKLEQSRIAAILSSAADAIEKEELYKQKLFYIKCGLLEDLLTGTVHVNHLAK